MAAVYAVGRGMERKRIPHWQLTLIPLACAGFLVLALTRYDQRTVEGIALAAAALGAITGWWAIKHW